MQFERPGFNRQVFRAHASCGGQDLRRIIRHGGDDVGASEQCGQAVELGHGEDDVAFAVEFLEVFVDEAAQVAGEGDQCMGAGAEVVEAQRAGYRVGAQQLRLAPAQDFALGVGGQVLGVADADGNLPGGKQGRHEDVIDSPDYQHNARRFGAQTLEQGGQQCELDVIGQADAEDRGAGRRVELRGAADRCRDGVECRGEQGEDFRRPGGGLHAAPGAHEQWIIEQAA